MAKKSFETDVVKVLKIFVKLRFSTIRQHAKFLMEAYSPSLEDVSRQFESASGEIADMLADEAAAINELIDQTVPLILLRTYATYEAFVFKFIGMVTYNPRIKIEADWIKAKKCLEGIGIPWDSFPGVQQVETMRLLINSYKHHDGKIHNKDLASRLGKDIGEHIDWGNIKYEEYILSCEKVLNGLINKIK